MFLLSVFALLAVVTVQAFPSLVARDSIPGLVTSQINDFNPYTYFAKAVYCGATATLSWTCGVACTNTPGFEPIASGGDGNGVQFWYVGYYPTLSSVIVAHQGTNTSQILADLTDLELLKEKLDSSLFPGLDHDIEAHRGFQKEHAKTADVILSSVQSAMSQYNTKTVTIVGHSLGAALAVLDSVYLPLNLPTDTTFKTVVYGLPRVGNKDFANYVDSHCDLTHINNLKDPVPIVPGQFLGYEHPAGEVHITETGKWAECPGHDNEDQECIVGDVPSAKKSVEADHDGPYNGIRMLCDT